MVELVDTPDLGSGALCAWRFESFPRYTDLSLVSLMRDEAFVLCIAVMKQSVI